MDSNPLKPQSTQESLGKLHSHFAAFSPIAAAYTEQQIKDLHDYITATPEGAKWLDSHLKALESVPKITEPVASPLGFQNSSVGNGSLLIVVFYAQSDVSFPAIGKGCKTKSGGFFLGIPAVALFGTLYYNDINDLNGDCDVQMGSVSQYFYINYIRGGSVFATYQAGGVGVSLPSIGGGTGEWSG